MTKTKKETMQVGSWTIEKDGTMTHDSPYYYIEGPRLGTENWIMHMAGKRWVDLRTFVRAYFTACQVRGIRTVTLRTDFMF